MLLPINIEELIHGNTVEWERLQINCQPLLPPVGIHPGQLDKIQGEVLKLANQIGSFLQGNVYFN